MAANTDRQLDPLRARTSKRDEALARLSRLTTATAVAGTFATVGFAGLAAVTYTGTPGADTTTLDGTTTNGQQQTQNNNQVLPVPTPRVYRGTTNQQPVTINPPTSTRGRSHVTTGGS